MQSKHALTGSTTEASADQPLLKSQIDGERKGPMSDLTKNEAIIEALESAGYQDIRLKVVPKRFLFSDGCFHTELDSVVTRYGAKGQGNGCGRLRGRMLSFLRSGSRCRAIF